MVINEILTSNKFFEEMYGFESNISNIYLKMEIYRIPTEEKRNILTNFRSYFYLSFYEYCKSANKRELLRLYNV